MTKTDTYIGFAVKSGQVIYGQETVKRSQDVKCAVISSTASDKTKKEMIFYARKNGIPLIEYQGELTFTKSGSCKVAGITGLELAKAVVESLAEGYREIVTGGGLNDTN